MRYLFLQKANTHIFFFLEPSNLGHSPADDFHLRSHCCPSGLWGVSPACSIARHHHWARYFWRRTLQCEATLPRPVLPHVRDDRQCPSNDWREEGCHLTTNASLWGHRTHPAHPQGALHHPPRVPVLQVYQPYWYHVCSSEGCQLHPLPQPWPPPVSGSNRRSQHTLLCVVEPWSHAVLCVRPA